jgi:hypothetical protein
MYFRTKLPFLELDCTAIAKCRIGISHHSMDNQQKKEHLMKSGIFRLEELRFAAAAFIVVFYIDFHRKLPF